VGGFISTGLQRINKVTYLNGESLSNPAALTWFTWVLN
jgi:hypothetical protein